MIGWSPLRSQSESPFLPFLLHTREPFLPSLQSFCYKYASRQPSMLDFSIITYNYRYVGDGDKSLSLFMGGYLADKYLKKGREEDPSGPKMKWPLSTQSERERERALFPWYQYSFWEPFCSILFYTELLYQITFRDTAPLSSSICLDFRFSKDSSYCTVLLQDINFRYPDFPNLHWTPSFLPSSTDVQVFFAKFTAEQKTSIAAKEGMVGSNGTTFSACNTVVLYCRSVISFICNEAATGDTSSKYERTGNGQWSQSRLACSLCCCKRGWGHGSEINIDG